MTDAFLERRRAAAAEAWNLDGGVVLVAAGDTIPVPGRVDRTYPFRAHSEYLYLADRERPGGVLAYAPADGWVEFVAPVTADELLWTGLEGDREGVPEGTRPLGEAADAASSCATRSSRSAVPRTTSSSSTCARPRRRRAPASKSSCR